MVKSQPILRYILRLIPAILAAVVLTACSSPDSQMRSKKTDTHAVNSQKHFLLQASQDEFETLVKNLDTKSKILNQYADWKGVAYRLGGNTKRGIDCSAFVQRTFHDQFDIDLPRSTSEQQKIGQTVSRSKLRAGDLVLFKTGIYMRHVGIYIGNNQFVHASTSNGVIVSKLTDTYWTKRYYGARRVLRDVNKVS
ncbi:bifunctional murein DD-endopeptidase/murein LD-carboxypeptidase [Xenorhabdus bovienii]|uniref:Suppresses thermosensitivity of prc mutants at low osmolality (Lipoprotein) n=4 Tax=Xenorhabdus bovienii TaxID=40576 RepID=A0A077P3W7_XENBV|nr:bifunctional murein DD-endopeptidase/murein LD-carboxypeptidase [Xenorhabdus bovienii]MCG3472267.1 bifunctional murein DD-endopeptidase/murein LD-carboxypeptidase [Xenorhabdus bovienii]MCP9267148.1 bifunctional murein DD-endopeptidase/murein LD-carboxypeptidase [Xenorhabdus bovienii subsp. africana]MDE1473357.1 bifunctional murein DD-endopeptidase/murein LD-carboxypeptidase [Xenorhabdus bovienii]MDE1481235.1 bifunctional murein DD-endopeptidase/murein LD-carboxypeptidase [Xenorhabdus bovieni